MKPRTYLIIGTVMVIVLFLSWCSQTWHEVRVLVQDAETGQPIAGATIDISRQRTYWVFGHGWNGSDPPHRYTSRSSHQGRSQRALYIPRSVRTFGVGASAPGYYPGGKGVQAYTTEGDKSTPEHILIALRPIRNPQAMYARRFNQTSPLHIPVANEDVEFDLQRSDWLPPYGEGEHADMIFHMVIGEKHGETYPMDYGATGILVDVKVTMRFPNGGGMIALSGEDLPASAFKWPYEAPENGYEPRYDVIWHQVDKDQPNARNHSWQAQENQRFMFRTRPVAIEGGEEREFHYGRIHEPPRLHFTDRRNNLAEIGVSFSYAFNPIPGERSMEFDVSRNLFKGSDLVPSQYLGGFQP